jgi:hypothetical protein
MGNAKEAIALLMGPPLNDVSGAVAVAASFDDDKIWTALLERALSSKSGQIIGALLDSIPNTPLNPLRVLVQLPANVSVPNLQV